MKTSRKFALFLLLLVAPARHAALADDGGSGYSRYGIGDLQYYTMVSDLGMANAGLALLSPLSLTSFNPASWTQVNRARLALGTMTEEFSSTDSYGSVRLGGTRFGGAIFALPLVVSSGITLTAGINPYSRVNYNTQIQTTQGEFQYTLSYVGAGGLSLAHIGLSGTVASSLSLGAKLDYYTGTLTHTVRQTFAGTDFTTAGVDRETRLDGIGATFGFVYGGLRSVFGLPQGQSLTIGGVLSTPVTLTAVEERYYTYTTTITSYDTLIGPDGTFHLPMSFAVGMAWQSEHLTVASDFGGQRWTDARSNGVPLVNIRNSYRWSGGMEFIPKRESSAPFFQRLAYRGGLFYDATYYDIGGVAINEMGVAAGFAASVFGESRFAVGISYALRGTTDQQLQKAKILRISLTLNVGEVWFSKPPEE